MASVATLPYLQHLAVVSSVFDYHVWRLDSAAQLTRAEFILQSGEVFFAASRQWQAGVGGRASAACGTVCVHAG